VLDRALAKDPGERFTRCGEFVIALEQALQEAEGWLAGGHRKRRALAPTSPARRPAAGPPAAPTFPSADDLTDWLIEELIPSSPASARSAGQALSSWQAPSAAAGRTAREGPPPAQQPPRLEPPGALPPAGEKAAHADAKKVAVLITCSLVFGAALFLWLYAGSGLFSDPSRGAAAAALQPSSLRIMSEAAAPASPGVPYLRVLAAEGGLAPFHWSVVEGDLPPGLSLDSRSGIIEGKPLAVGSYPVEITVTDSEGLQAALSLSIEVAPGLLVRTPPELPSGVLRRMYRTQLAVEGGEEPYRWELASGSLPAGLALELDGLLVGRPSAEGVSRFDIRVSDSADSSTVQSFELRVGSGLTLLSSADLPAGSVGSPFVFQLEADGGSPPYAWSLAGGALPAGLALQSGTGLIQGRPANAGRFGCGRARQHGGACSQVVSHRGAVGAFDRLPAGAAQRQPEPDLCPAFGDRRRQLALSLVAGGRTASAWSGVG
jgi:hypothetical protein